MFKMIIVLFTLGSNPNKIETNTCNKDWSMLQLDQKIELAIGCSKVGKRRVYSTYRLGEIYGGR